VDLAPKAIILGLVAGFLGGMFGVGGGIVMVPGLVLLLSFQQHRAHATSIATIVAIATAGVIPFAMEGEVDWLHAAVMVVGSLTGAYFGARYVSKIPAVWLARAFVAVALVASVRFLVAS
jgi:uncharacterized membrane protein YfcA